MRNAVRRFFSSFLIAIVAIPSLARPASAVENAPTGAFADRPAGPAVEGSASCRDWKVGARSSFSAGLEEYLRFARASGPRDWSCLSRSTWHLLDQLFDPRQEGDYDARMAGIAEIFARAQASDDARTVEAVEELVYVMQYQWLTVMYERLAAYNSTRSHVVAASAVGVTAGLVGATLLARSRPLKDLRRASRGMAIKVLRHVGRRVARSLLSARSAGAAMGAVGAFVTGPGYDPSIKAPPPAPLDYLDGGSRAYANHTDLQFYKDLAVLVASGAAGYAAAATAEFYFLKAMKLVAGAGRAARHTGKAHLAAAAASFAVGVAIEKSAEAALVRGYHAWHRQRVADMRARLAARDLDDWQTFVAASDLTSALIQWLSTQEAPITSETFEAVVGFRRHQVCSRLLFRTLDEPSLPHWERFGLSPDKMERIAESGERSLRQKAVEIVRERADRLRTIRSAIVIGHYELGALGSPYVENFRTQLRILISRIDALSERNEMVEAEIASVREIVATLAPGSPKWEDAAALRGVANAFHCLHPNVYGLPYGPQRSPLARPAQKPPPVAGP